LTVEFIRNTRTRRAFYYVHRNLLTDVVDDSSTRGEPRTVQTAALARVAPRRARYPSGDSKIKQDMSCDLDHELLILN